MPDGRRRARSRPRPTRRDDVGPRVGDGLIRLDADGRVTYASPNAQSAYRRLGLTGDLLSEELAPLTGRLARTRWRASEVAEPDRGGDRREGAAPREIEARGATVLVRALPLLPNGRPRARWCWSATSPRYAGGTGS